MKQSNLIAGLKALLALTFVAFFSSVAFAGGDKYEIYLNKKLMTEQFVTNQTISLKSLQLSNANSNDELTVYYSHCGEVGTGRSILLKDEKNNVLKEWKFSDGSSAAMTIKVKDILEIQKKNAKAEITLVYYSSKYLPKGRSLTAIKVNEKNTAQIKNSIKKDDLSFVKK